MIRVRKHPEGYFILIDGEIVAEAGQNGVMKSREVALQLRDALELATQKDVKVYAGYGMTEGK